MRELVAVLQGMTEMHAWSLLITHLHLVLLCSQKTSLKPSWFILTSLLAMPCTRNRIKNVCVQTCSPHADPTHHLYLWSVMLVDYGSMVEVGTPHGFSGTKPGKRICACLRLLDVDEGSHMAGYAPPEYEDGEWQQFDGPNATTVSFCTTPAPLLHHS